MLNFIKRKATKTPIPPRGRGRPPKYGFQTLEVGEELVFTDSDLKTLRFIQSRAVSYARYPKWKIVTQIVGDTLTVRRVA